MLENRFFELCRLECEVIWKLISIKDGTSITIESTRYLAQDLRDMSKVADRLDEICDTAEM